MTNRLTDRQMDGPIFFILNRLPEYGLNYLCTKFGEDSWKTVSSRVGQTSQKKAKFFGRTDGQTDGQRTISF